MLMGDFEDFITSLSDDELIAHRLLKESGRRFRAQARADFNRDRFAELFDKYKEDPIELLIRQYQNEVSLVGLGEIHSLVSNHRFAKCILAPIQDLVGLDYLCLELERFLQPEIDNYFVTGDERYLQKVIDREKELVRRGLPVQGRIDYGYFDILREARKLRISIIAMDVSETGMDTYMHSWYEYRNEDMVEKIPKDGRGIFYCGENHVVVMGKMLKKERGNSKVYLMTQVAEESVRGAHEKLLSESLSNLGYTSSVAIDFRINKDLYSLLKDNGLMGEAFVARFDSVVYHP